MLLSELDYEYVCMNVCTYACMYYMYICFPSGTNWKTGQGGEEFI